MNNLPPENLLAEAWPDNWYIQRGELLKPKCPVRCQKWTHLDKDRAMADKITAYASLSGKILIKC